MIQSNPLPSGYRRSAWKDLDPYGREVLLRETVAATGRTVLGEVNYETGWEPMLYDWAGGDFWSIAGERVETTPISVGVIDPILPPWWWRWALVGLLAAGLIFVARRV